MFAEPKYFLGHERFEADNDRVAAQQLVDLQSQVVNTGLFIITNIFS